MVGDFGVDWLDFLYGSELVQLIFGIAFLFFWMFMVFLFYVMLVMLGLIGVGTPLWFILKGEEDGKS